MCLACGSSLIAKHLTSELWRAEPSRRHFLATSAAAAVVAMTAGREAYAAEVADAIFSNGTIYPMTAAGRPVEALAIGGGKILASGSASDVSSLAHGATRIVDLQGRVLFPGFIDPHHHTILSALVVELTTNIGFEAYRTGAEALDALKALAAKTPTGQWIAASFYDNLLQGGDLSMTDLDAVSTRHPIFVIYVNGHEGAANGLAFQLANIPEDVGELPGGGHFGRGPDGKLNGLIYEPPALLRFMAVALPPTTPELMAKSLASYAKRVAATGNTTLHEPGTIKPEWVPMLAKLSNTLAVRMSGSLNTDSVEASKPFASLGRGDKARKIPDSRFSLYGIKFWADGSNQAESGAQTRPYLGGESKGFANYSVEKMKQLCEAARDAGWPILIHCQGDAGVDDALDAIEAAYGANPATGLNVLQHATMARQDQLERAKRLNLGITFLPDLIFLYGATYRDRLFGPERTASAVPIGAWARLGMPFSLHTDAPVSPAGPLRLAQIAVTRRCAVDNSIIGPNQAVTIDEALKAITIIAARHIGLEDTIGSLEVGKEADLTILESDPYKASPDAIAGIKVSETWVAGERKFAA
jgi:predicted amidohydrolase YtcJ